MAQEDVADEDAVQHRLVEPLRVRVVEILQLVGPDVGDVIALRGDHTEVEEGGLATVEQTQQLAQLARSGELLGAGRVGQRFQRGGALGQEDLDRVGGGGGQVA
jgi:hypothetical protein